MGLASGQGVVQACMAHAMALAVAAAHIITDNLNFEHRHSVLQYSSASPGLPRDAPAMAAALTTPSLGIEVVHGATHIQYGRFSPGNTREAPAMGAANTTPQAFAWNMGTMHRKRLLVPKLKTSLHMTARAARK